MIPMWTTLVAAARRLAVALVLIAVFVVIAYVALQLWMHYVASYFIGF